MDRLLIAIGFLTKIPISKNVTIDDKNLARSMAYFPLIGFFLGLILAAVNVALTPFLPDRLANVILILLLILLTGGLHLDGFADTVDGFCAKTKDKEKILGIMKDSRMGAMGVIGLVMLILLKYEALNSISSQFKSASLILMCSISRWGQVFAAYFSKYAREEGTGRSFIGKIGSLEIILATMLVFAVSFLLFFPKAILLLLLITIAIWGFMRYCHKKIGGMTGDTVGALSEMAEVAVLLGIIILSRIKIGGI